MPYPGPGEQVKVKIKVKMCPVYGNTPHFGARNDGQTNSELYCKPSFNHHLCGGNRSRNARNSDWKHSFSLQPHTRVYYLRFQTRKASTIIMISKSRIMKGSRSPTSTLSCRGRRSRFNCTHEKSTQACDVLEACCLLPLLPLKTWK